ncbi:mechanosensitive ion channel protein MscS [Halochromatium salexigens]|uniref:Small-conductance mechanosensitive channel n=1 Tax=Halochromatium salexigens TaxID=49447 RepID=A0AAJ0XFZ6_HALSE|nr:mechanosensitive ion channel family protein [Halochromatium salexigens]MBK5930212.1 mechanosensitive ion channel protein MscS [Halochromatium salexigens]
MQDFIDQLTASYWELLLGLLLLVVLWRIGCQVVGKRPLTKHFPLVTALLDVVVLPMWVIIIAGLLRHGLRMLELPSLLGPVAWWTDLFVNLSVAWAIGRVVTVIAKQRRRRRNRGEHIPKLIEALLSVSVLMIALGSFMWQQGYSFTGVWVSTGVAAGVIGLALQRTLSDLLAGVSLGIERPFRIGDWLELPEEQLIGQVVDLNWRATRLRGWDNATVVIPNARMANAALKNYYSDHHLYAPWYFVRIPGEVSPRFASALLLDAAMRCDSVLHFPNPVVRLADASKVPYSYMVWVHLRNYPSMFRAREELYREIHLGLQEAGIEVAPEITEMRTRRAHVNRAEPPTVALALRSLDVAGVLSDDELNQLAARSEYRYFDLGDQILAEGGISDAFYVIIGGLVDSSIRLPDGSSKVIETLGPGKHFGISEMLTTQVNFLEFTANTDVTLIRIDLEAVRALITQRPELGEYLAEIVKTRLDAADAARVASRRPVRRLSLRDVREGIERRLRSRGSRGGPRG